MFGKSIIIARLVQKEYKMLTRFLIIFLSILSIGLLSIGGLSQSINSTSASKWPDILSEKKTNQDDPVNIIDGIQYIEFKAALVITPSI